MNKQLLSLINSNDPHRSPLAKFIRFFQITRDYIKLTYKIEQDTGTFTQKQLYSVKAAWANDVLKLLNVEINVKKMETELHSCIYVGNHISYLDIPLVLNCVQANFVSKQEVSNWPIIGSALKRSGTLLVKRGSAESRSHVATQIANAVKNDNKKICIFPSGTTSLNEHKPWRNGIFKIAQQNQIPIIPFRLTYEPLRKTAYIDKDFFPLHFYKLLRTKKISATIEFGSSFYVKNPGLDCTATQDWTKKLNRQQD
ncbi:MAG: 1-acyl-sn-glycerol-3-phosphate acyltransferase [Oligoflexales bacterium]|nr:1-acyl-sn-glycerol-3-phosphate acyltransferase [Oligoflexales bacterium]